MLKHIPFVDDLKDEATTIQENDKTISRTTALNMVAKNHGYKSWNVLKALNDDQKNNALKYIETHYHETVMAAYGLELLSIQNPYTVGHILEKTCQPEMYELRKRFFPNSSFLQTQPYVKIYVDGAIHTAWAFHIGKVTDASHEIEIATTFNHDFTHHLERIGTAPNKITVAKLGFHMETPAWIFKDCVIKEKDFDHDINTIRTTIVFDSSTRK